MSREFEEIAHSGGIVRFTLHIDESGNKAISFKWSHSRPVPTSLVSYYVLPPGLVIEPLSVGGMGTPWPTPSVPGSIPIMIASDSEDQFGHNCPYCSAYWRSGPFSNFCPYCGASGTAEQFLSIAQRRFAEFYCQKWSEIISQVIEGFVEINLDEVADATLNSSIRPEFYISDERQQTQLECSSCGEFNDILGRFGHCSRCFTRNDLHVFIVEIVDTVRANLVNGLPPERQLQDLFSAFETLVKSYLRSLVRHVPLTPERRDKVSKDNYSPNAAYQAFLEAFGIDIRAKISEAQIDFVNRMIERRHVFEHNGGVVDQKYLDKTNDRSVRLGQKLSQDSREVFDLANVLVKCAENIHTGYHSILPPKAELINSFQKSEGAAK